MHSGVMRDNGHAAKDYFGRRKWMTGAEHIGWRLCCLKTASWQFLGMPLGVWASRKAVTRNCRTEHHVAVDSLSGSTRRPGCHHERDEMLSLGM